MARVLYIDVPFENESGGDKNRSRFIWKALRAGYDADLLLIHPHGAQPRSRPAYSKYPPILELHAARPGVLDSDSVLRISPIEARNFLDLLSRHPYDAVVCRFHSPWLLARIAANHSSHPAIVIDLDMVSSRLVGLSWRQAPSFRNRWFLFERLKLERLERRLLRMPWLVLLSNPVERDQLGIDVVNPESQVQLGVLPNVLFPSTTLLDAHSLPIILFFGTLDSAANTDAFRYLIQDILPLVDADLRRHGVRIHVAGQNPPAWFATLLQASGTDRVHLVGPVESMEQAIAESRFVLLPLRIASGTRTRILEAAAQLRTVVTTPLGAEGISVGQDAVIARDAEGLAIGIRRLLEAPDRPIELGRRLGARCLDRYAESRVTAELLHLLNSFLLAHRETRPQ